MLNAEPNLARNRTSITCSSSSKYANNSHANLFLPIPTKKSCKRLFLKRATIHAAVVLNKRAHTDSAVNLLHYLFPLLIHTLERETTSSRDKTTL